MQTKPCKQYTLNMCTLWTLKTKIDWLFKSTSTNQKGEYFLTSNVSPLYTHHWIIKVPHTKWKGRLINQKLVTPVVCVVMKQLVISRLGEHDNTTHMIYCRLYGAETVCHSCRIFFRRIVQAKKTLTCIMGGSGKCSFDKLTRNKCR